MRIAPLPDRANASALAGSRSSSFGALDGRSGWLALALAAVLFATACESGGGGGEETPSVARPVSATCVAPARPGTGSTSGGPGSEQLELTFDAERFPDALGLVQHPTNDARWYVVRKSGEVDTFLATDPGSTRTRAVTVAVVTDIEMGLLGLAFHPDFDRNGWVFLSYVRATSGSGAGVSVLARYVSDDGGLTFRPDGPDFEILSFEQPAGNHNGGAIAFGPRDGYLYAAFGDGGRGSTIDAAQSLDDFFGTIIRIDVDVAPYASPPDNPFVGRAGRDEIWAYGFRNPWRFSFDPVTGDLWIGDVGQSSFEEIDRIADRDNAGGNYGWPIKEGFSCFDGSSCGGRSDLIDPIHAYARDQGVSVTGGFVYRGRELAWLDGAYVFGDFGSGRIWSLREVPGDDPTVTELTNLRGQLVSFGQDRAGEIFIVDLGGRLFELASDGSGTPVDPFPTQLSRTGCFDPFDVRTPVDGLIPYEIAMPFWSDGAEKERFMSVPANRDVTVRADGHLEFPIGTVLAKHFAINGRTIETRLFMRHDDGNWGGYSYEWNASGTDATLLETSKRETIDGIDWLYPGRADCFRCHTAAAGFSLGPEIAQMNFPIRHPDGRTENQIDRLVASGVITGGLPALSPETERMPSLDDASASLEGRARAYLSSNCAYCHRPGGPGTGTFDLRFATPAAAAGYCDAIPIRGDLGVAGARVVFPGEPNLSVLLLRMLDLGNDRMPAFASERVHDEAVTVIRDWIADLDACP